MCILYIKVTRKLNVCLIFLSMLPSTLNTATILYIHIGITYFWPVFVKWNFFPPNHQQRITQDRETLVVV